MTNTTIIRGHQSYFGDGFKLNIQIVFYFLFLRRKKIKLTSDTSMVQQGLSFSLSLRL